MTITGIAAIGAGLAAIGAGVGLDKLVEKQWKPWRANQRCTEKFNPRH